ncbi:two-component regulator propeller domain-containing protein [Aquimarina mytili]
MYFPIHAQKTSLKYIHYGKQNGLNQSSVNFIYQDSEDYLWIANFGGVNKFDGYTFTSYVNEFNNNTSISDNSVWVIIEDSHNTLWFGTKTGLSKYNKKHDNFTNYFIRDTSKKSGTLAVKALYEDKKGRFYIGSEGDGLFVFSKEEESFYPVKNIPKNAKVSAITEDFSGNLWVATENLGLFQISSDRSKVIHVTNTQPFTSKGIWSLYADQKRNIWIGTDSDGLVRYSTDTEQFIFYKNQSDIYDYKAGDKIKTITQGHQGQIWIGSATKGLSYFSYEENRFYNYIKDSYDANSLFDNDVSSIFAGANGVLYVGFYMKGFDKIISTPFFSIKNNPKKENTLSNNNVYCMYKDRDEMLWFGTFGGGLNRFNPQTNQFKQYRYDENDPNSISHDWVRIIFEDRENTMWIGTWGGGLNRFDKNTGRFKRYLPIPEKNNSLNHNIITALFQDIDGELWIGTYGGGINIYQPETDDFKSITHDPNNLESLSDDHITSFYQDEKGIIWICTYGGGLNAYDKHTGKFERFLPDSEKEFSLNNHKTLHIFDEPEQNFFWITTLGGGINKLYYNEKKFIHYTEKDGLANNSTMGMLSDHKGMYWISTNNGLSRFNPDKETFTNYTMNDGLNSDDYNLEAYIKTKEGTLYFGGKNGITYFNPKDVSPNKKFPSVLYTTFKIEDSIHGFIPKKIEVPYKKRITFEYAAINPDKVNNINYAYQLIGRDEDWRSMNKNRYLEFTNLDPGHYELRVKSTNSSGLWDEKYTSISIYISPPWYMSWYFRVGMVLIVLISIYSYYKIKINQVRRRNKLLEETVSQRTRTIAQKNIALKEEKDKTEQAYKQLKKLEGFKDEFTGMLAHDLKNPLVTILGYSSENSSDSDLQSINKSGKRMLYLIENMLEVQKFENTEVQLNYAKNNLRNLAIEAINQVDVLAGEKRIQIVNGIDTAYNVEVDKEMIERVFVNLLTNAIKFSHTDTEIEILVEVKSHKPEEVILCVRDNGDGIPQDQLPLVFSKFSQVEARNSGNSRSTGLGLTFCKMAVEAHNGNIWVESEIKKGASFFFSLPRIEDSMITKDDNKDEDVYENPLYNLKFETKDFDVLFPFIEKINTLTIYEMGEWLGVFDDLAVNETKNIQIWKDLMMEALTNFDESAFSYLKKMIVNTIIK